MDKNPSIQEVIDMIKQFTAARAWSRFHSPKNLAMALSGEVGELNALLQWVDDGDSWAKEHLEDLRNELADIAIYLLLLSDRVDIDLPEAIQNKLKINESRYPVEKVTGRAVKYNEL